jgi:hypothetical protein
MSQAVHHDHYPEIVENDQGTRRLELLGLSERLRDPADRRALFATMTPENFTQMFGYINSITQGQEINYEYQDGKFVLGATPSLEDKAPLMELTAKTIQDIATNPDIDDRTALRRIGLTGAGAITYIHPKANGNGRSGRVWHYVAEFGTERGDEAFNEELYAVIGKLPVYDSDKQVSIVDTTPPALDRALEAHVAQADPKVYASASDEERASMRVVAFLDMMSGSLEVPIDERVVLRRTREGKRMHIEYAEPGEINGVQLYEQKYLNDSAIPNRLPTDVPEGAQRVMARKVSLEASEGSGLAFGNEEVS